MKISLEIVKILAAYDLTETLRGATELTLCSHHTVARHVAARDAGQPIAEPAYRGRVTDPFLPRLRSGLRPPTANFTQTKSTGSCRPSVMPGRNNPRGEGWHRSASTISSVTFENIAPG